MTANWYRLSAPHRLESRTDSKAKRVERHLCLMTIIELKRREYSALCVCTTPLKCWPSFDKKDGDVEKSSNESTVIRTRRARAGCFSRWRNNRKLVIGRPWLFVCLICWKGRLALGRWLLLLLLLHARVHPPRCDFDEE